MYARELKSERMYTLKEAREIIEREEQAKRSELLKWIAYKLLAVLCFAICLITPALLDGDATIWFIFIPCGIYFLTRKEGGAK